MLKSILNKNFTNFKRVIILLFFQCFCLNTTGPALPEYGNNLNKSFYRLLESIRNTSPDEQLTALQTFLEKYPEFAPVYHTLIEWYRYHDKIPVAKAYFQQLSHENRYSPNNHWAMAKLYALENTPQLAFESFHMALQAGTPPAALLNDYAEFSHQHPESSPGLDLISQLGLESGSEKMARAFFYYFKFQYQAAIEVFRELPKAISHDPTILNTWGYCYYRLSQYSQADSLWQLGIEISDKQGDLKAKAKFLSNHGLYFKQIHSNYSLALSCYDSAYAIATRISDWHRMQMLAGYRAYIHRDRGNYAEAEKQFKVAIEICSRIGKPRFLADWNRGYAITLYLLGRYQEALNKVNESEKYTRMTKNDKLLIENMMDKVDILITLRQLELARETIHKALELSEISNLIYFQKLAKAKLGKILLIEGNYAKAREYFEEFINLLEKNDYGAFGKIYLWLERVGKSYQLSGQYEQARSQYLKAIDASRKANAKSFEGWYHLRAADVELFLKNFEAARDHYDQAYDIALELGIKEMLWEIYLGYGNTYRQTGDYVAAISAYRRAADIVENTRRDLNVDQLRIGYFIEGHQAYRNLVQCYRQRYLESNDSLYLDSLFYYNEMGKARALQDLKSENRSFADDEEYQKTLTELRTLQRRIRLQAENFATLAELDGLLSQLETTRLSLLAQKLLLTRGDTLAQHAQVSVPSLSAVLAYLKKFGLGLLVYHISEEGSFVLAATGERAGIVPLQVTPAQLDAAVDSLLTPFHLVQEDSIQFIPFRAAIAYQLYRLLIEPVEKVLLSTTNVVIVPDLALEHLPFDMLLTHPPNRPAYLPGEFPAYADDFLVHRYTITHSPNTSILLESGDLDDESETMLLVANPFGMDSKAFQSQLRSRTGWRFDPLPFAEIEAKKIMNIQPNVQLYKGKDATRAAFKKEASKHRIIHIASHAFVNTSFDAFSGLVLAAGSDSTDDGLLMGYEIPDTNLKCDLIALSACETGRGRLVASEGVLGLPRLFLGAGANSVLMTLWKVDDKFASDLMPQFYEYLLKQKWSKSKSLSGAKRMILTSESGENGVYYQHPLYWAAFNLYGDPGTHNNPLPFSNRFLQSMIAISILSLIIAGSVFFYRTRKK